MKRSIYQVYDSYLVASLDFVADADSGGRLDEGVDLGVENVDPARLVGILVGVPSSLTRESVDPCREAGRDVGRDVLGVRLDLIGIEVLVVSVLEGVGRPKDAESE
jgi:hypothetical protein